MIFPLPDARDRLGWTWIFREIARVHEVYQTDPYVIELPMEVFRHVAERVNPAFVEGHFLALHKMLISDVVVRGRPQLQDQMDIKGVDEAGTIDESWGIMPEEGD